MKTVSLIIPVYNTEKYLRKCLDSVVQQTYPQMEIICVDDGSTDLSGKIVDEYSTRDSRIIAVHQPNAGESAARNTGLGLATGEYIGFMDCDDWIEPDMYETLVELLEENDADMAIGSWFCETEISQPIKNEKTVKKGAISNRELMRYLYERDSYRAFAYMWDKLYKREILFDRTQKPILFNEELELGGDVLCLGQIALRTQKAVYIDKPFYHYMQRPDSGCHTRNIKKRMDWLKAYQILIALFEKENVYPEVIELTKRFLVYHSGNVVQIATEQHNDDAKETAKAIMKLYENEYKKTNADNKERLEWFERIILQ